MSALPKWSRLRTTLAADVRHGAPLELIELEPAECVTWIAEESEYDIAGALADAIGAVEQPKQRERLVQLVTEMMGDMTADRLIELRDELRGILKDYCSDHVRRVVGDDLGYVG